jgi:hypothetical protein
MKLARGLAIALALLGQDHRGNQRLRAANARGGLGGG